MIAFKNYNSTPLWYFQSTSTHMISLQLIPSLIAFRKTDVAAVTTLLPQTHNTKNRWLTPHHLQDSVCSQSSCSEVRLREHQIKYKLAQCLDTQRHPSTPHPLGQSYNEGSDTTTWSEAEASNNCLCCGTLAHFSRQGNSAN